MNSTTHRKPEIKRPFAHRAMIAAAIAAAAIVLLVFLDQISKILLLFFAGVLFSLLLDSGAQLLRRYSPLKRGWALLVFCLALALVLIALGWFTGGSVSDQLDELGRRLPAAWQQLQDYLMQWSWVRSVADDLPSGAQSLDGNMVNHATAAISTVMGAVGAILATLVIGVYLAAAPGMYIGVALAVIPPEKRKRAGEVFTELGVALRRWLFGRLLSMLVVGTLTWLALWILGVPLALPLGVIAGILSFIPYLGPILAAAPAVLIGFSEGSDMAIHVALIYLAVQLVESYLITPLIEHKAVRIPPAFQITTQLIGGLLAGFTGILLASPLLVVVTALVQMLYIQDVLGESEKLIGQQ